MGWGPVRGRRWDGDQYGEELGWGPVRGGVKSKPCELEPAVCCDGGCEGGVALSERGVALLGGQKVGGASSDPVVLP